MANIKLGISSCLLGNRVRYDGGHKLDHYIHDILGQFVEFVPVCPEVEIGLGIPREALRQVGKADSPRLITRKSGIDHTDAMLSWAEKRCAELKDEDLCGFIFKAASPSSGMRSVKVYNQDGIPSKSGVGIFARAFMQHFPLLPVEDEGRLHDTGLRENFITRIFVMQRWQELNREAPRLGALINFHTRHKLLIMAHSVETYRSLGKLLAEGKQHEIRGLYSNYLEQLMGALKLRATVRKNTNVLMHMLGYFKKELDKNEKQELLELIEQYRKENIPLIVPVTLLNHYVSKYEQPYLKEQFYLNPHPLELKLRNHA